MAGQVHQRSAGEMIRDYIRDFKVLKETRSEYWGIQIINLLDCTIYFALLTIAAVFLSQDLGFSDQQAGYVVTIFTSATTLFLFISGAVADWLGIRRSIFIAMGVMLVLRLGVAVCGLDDAIPHRATIVAVLFFLMAPFMAMIQTVFQAANKRFTTRKSRSAGFTVWYLFMNIGAAAGGYSIDVVRKILALPNSYVFVMGVALAILCIITALLMIRNEDQLLGEDEQAEADALAAKNAANGIATAKIERKNPIQIFSEVIRESAFWRLTVLIALLLGVRAVFAYFYLLMPKYWLRTIGEDAAIGTLSAINPVLIVVGLLLFIPIANKFNLFKMLTYGALVSALAMFALVVPWQMISSNIATAHYTMAVIFIVVLSIGEIIWSPKLSEYTAAVAPAGQEGTYLGFTMIPWFLAKTIVSALSGHMLAKWSPEGIGEKMVAGEVGFWEQPAAMWMILSLIAVAGVILAIALKPWFTKGAKWEMEQEQKAEV